MDNFLGDLSKAQLATINPKKKIKINNRLVTAKCSLDVLQWTLLFALIAAMDDTTQTMGFYKVSAAEVADLLQINGKNRLRVVRDLCGTLVGTKVYMQINNVKGAPFDDELTWFSRLRSQPNNPYILFKMEDDLAQFLLNQDKGYVILKLAELLNFRRKYTFQIYALAVKHKKFKKGIFRFDELAEILDCPKSYLVGGLFAEKVLKPAIGEINQNTELQVSYTIEAKKLKLIINEKDKYVSFYESLSPEAQIAYTYCQNKLKVLPNAMITCVRKFGEIMFIQITNELRFKNPADVKNMSAYAATCLRNGYHSPEPTPVPKIDKPKTIETPEPTEPEQTPEAIAAKNAEKAKVNEILMELSSMSTEEQEQQWQQVITYCQNNKRPLAVLFAKRSATGCIKEGAIKNTYAKVILEMRGEVDASES